MNTHALQPAADDAMLARVAMLLRGLMAVPSGSEDDRHRRVILRRVPGPVPGKREARGAVIEVDLPAGEGEVEQDRTRLRSALQACEAQHGCRAAGVVVRGAAEFVVESLSADERLPLANKVALVTGAAGAIGIGICKALLKRGCYVAAADVDEQRLTTLVAELRGDAATQLAGVPMDVTSADSVRGGFADVARLWGGVDLVVVNAGAAMVSPLTEMELDGFRRLEAINVEGTLLTIAEAGRCLRLQGTGGDIVLISTKNVFCPGASFGAYSATKAAAHQLARVASLELAPFDIRVNMVAPDAVFGEGAHKSGLWAEVGPSRMRARGLDEKGLEEYYRSRNLLKARVTADHVANAVLFFATRQTPTTGATLPVDGGLPDSTPR